VRDIINGERSMLPTLWTTSWATKRWSYVNSCVAEENNLEEGLYIRQYSIIVLIQISTVICFCS